MQKAPRERMLTRGLRGTSAADLAGLQAGGAHVHALRGAVHHSAHALDVRVEASVGDLAGPRPVVAEARLLGADVADGSHRELLGSKTCVSVAPRPCR